MPLRNGLKRKRTKAAVALAGLLIAAGAAAPAVADSGAGAAAVGSPGILSGNVVQVPVNIPINVCGHSASVLALDPAAGNVRLTE